MKKLIISIGLFFAFMIIYQCASAQEKWCDKDPNHPLCICEKQPTHPNCCCTPVELKFFSASVYNTEKAILHWSTASEDKNNFFTIERSTDANSWEELGTVKGNGTTTETKKYQFIDENPNSKKLYYRLSQTDYDGTHKILGIDYVMFKWNIIDGFKVYGDVVTYHYFDSTGGISGNPSGLMILKVVTKQGLYIFKTVR